MQVRAGIGICRRHPVDVVEIDVVLHQVPGHVIVEIDQGEDHVVPLEADQVVDVGDLVQLHRLANSVGGAKCDVHGPVDRFMLASPRLTPLRFQRGVVPEHRHVEIVEAEIALVRRLIGPDGLHVVDDVVLHVQAQPVDLGQHAIVPRGGGGVLVDRHLQGRQLRLQIADQLVDLGLRAVQRVLGEVDSRPIGVAVSTLPAWVMPSGSKNDLTIATFLPSCRSLSSWLSAACKPIVAASSDWLASMHLLGDLVHDRLLLLDRHFERLQAPLPRPV